MNSDEGAKDTLDGEYTVEKIVACRNRKGRKEYKVKWEGYSMKECTWEPLDHLEGVMSLVKEFEQSNSEKAKKNKKRSKANQGSEFMSKKRSNSSSVSNDDYSSDNKSEENSSKSKKTKSEKENENKKEEDISKPNITEEDKKDEENNKNNKNSEHNSEKDQKQMQSEAKDLNHLHKKEVKNEHSNLENNKDIIHIDKNYKKVITVRYTDGRLIAMVEKSDNINTKPAHEYLTTKDLKEKNPLILLDFYESKIKFS